MMKNAARHLSNDLIVKTNRVSNYYKKLDVGGINTSTVINDKLSCLYYIDLGPLSSLYDTMRINDDKYPKDAFGSHRIGKFGLSKDMSSRLRQHQNQKNGYGRWSREVSLRWMILMSPSQLFKAESVLSNMLKANEFKFDHIDEFGKSHNELILSDPSKEKKLRGIYKQVLDLFPSKEDELSQTIEDNKKSYEFEIQMKDLEMKLQQEQSKNQMLELKLQLSKFE